MCKSSFLNAGPYCTSNDGNTARRFFQNADITADIIGVDLQLIEHLHVILTALSSGISIDASKLEAYCIETARLYVQNYPWYYMPQSLHRLLIHGPAVVRHMTLPIGMMSEEAQEARNKDFKKYREVLAKYQGRRQMKT